MLLDSTSRLGALGGFFAALREIFLAALHQSNRQDARSHKAQPPPSVTPSSISFCEAGRNYVKSGARLPAFSHHSWYKFTNCSPKRWLMSE